MQILNESAYNFNKQKIKWRTNSHAYHIFLFALVTSILVKDTDMSENCSFYFSAHVSLDYSVTTTS